MNEQDHRALLRLAYPQHHRSQPQQITTDFDVLKRHFKFAWREGEDDDRSTWGARMAKRYFDKLHKEYVLADLSRWKEGKVGLRWRVEREVVDGTGQYSCGSLGVGCRAREGLASYELNFRYQEGGGMRNELVKVRVCERCKELLDQARGGGGGAAAAGGKGRSSSGAGGERKVERRREEEGEEEEWRRRGEMDEGDGGGGKEKDVEERRERDEDASIENRKRPRQDAGKPTRATDAAAVAAPATLAARMATPRAAAVAAAAAASEAAAAAAVAAAEARRKEKTAAAMREMDDLIRDILDGKTDTETTTRESEK